MSRWGLVLDGYEVEAEKGREALCTLGNGYFATRGAAPEATAGTHHYPGTYVAGCYNRLVDEVEGRLLENESLVNLPNWLMQRVAVGDGEWFAPDAQNVEAFRQELDLRGGVLHRRLTFRDPRGRLRSVRDCSSPVARAIPKRRQSWSQAPTWVHSSSSKPPLALLDRLPQWRRDELAADLGLGEHEVKRWRAITAAMFVPFHDGVISQFEGYQRLERLDLEACRRRWGSIQRLDRLLEADGASVNSYEVSKQADVLMLFYLLAAEDLEAILTGLGYRFDPAVIPRTIDYYLARTSHGSTLSAVVHSWVLARSDRQRALQLFRTVLSSDIADIQRGTTAEGIHLGAMAGSVDLLQRCFTGLEHRDGVLWFNPSWPSELGSMRFHIWYRRAPLETCVSGSSVTVTSGAADGLPIRVGCGDRVVQLLAGVPVELTSRPDRSGYVSGDASSGAGSGPG